MTEIQLEKIEISYVLGGNLRKAWCFVPVDSSDINPMASIISDLELIAEGSDEHYFNEMQVKSHSSVISPQEFKCNHCGEIEMSYDELEGRPHKCTPDGDRLHDRSFGTFVKSDTK